MTAVSAWAREQLEAALAATAPVARRMAEAGYSLYLVGGVVRDIMRGQPFAVGGADLDCTTEARPSAVLRAVAPVASAVWRQGERFGTIGCRVDGYAFEITTHRADKYDPSSRKPAVTFGDNLIDDLYRRDFTVNAMAVDAADGALIDPCGGSDDLVAGLLRTPLRPEISFGEDPLRMLRAARFLAGHGLRPVPALTRAATEMGDRLAVVSAERIRGELQRLLMLDKPGAGIRFLAETGLLARAVPELGDDAEALGRTIAAVPPQTAPRWAALLAALTEEQVTARLRALRISNELVGQVVGFLWALRTLRTAPTDPAGVRRLVYRCPAPVDAAVEFARAVIVARGEPTASVDAFVAALVALREHEDLEAQTKPITAHEVMEALGVGPGPTVGRALAFLRERVLDGGPLSRQAATEALLSWHSAQGHSDSSLRVGEPVG